VVLDLDTARTSFDTSTDFTVGLEEEFALLDDDFGLTPAFDRMRQAAAGDPVLTESIAGELISSEIEIRSGRGADLAAAISAQRDRRHRLFGVAVSASSPFLDGQDSGLASARSQIFTKSFPRCGVPDAYGSWEEFAAYVDFLARTRSIVEYTQVWWSIRPHPAFGTVELRICDCQATAQESEGLAALMVACVAQAARDFDDGTPWRDLPRSLIDENVWRAVRYGLDGELIDLEAGTVFPAAAAVERLLGWTEPVRGELGLDISLPERNGAQRQRDLLQSGLSLEEAYRATVAQTRETYAPALEAQRR
jgi:carboxylate-amine ligase